MHGARSPARARVGGSSTRGPSATLAAYNRAGADVQSQGQAQGVQPLGSYACAMPCNRHCRAPSSGLSRARPVRLLGDFSYYQHTTGYAEEGASISIKGVQPTPYSYSLDDCTPAELLPAYIRRLLTRYVETGRTLIMGAYGSYSKQEAARDIATDTAAAGFRVAGSSSRGALPVSRVAWIRAARQR